MPTTFSYVTAANKYPIELMLRRPNTDIIGDFMATGAVVLTLQRNSTNQIIFGGG